MIISQDITPCFKANVGEHGVEEAAVMAFAQHTEPAIAELAALKGTGNLPMLDIPFDTSDIAEIEALAQYIREGFSTLVVLGTGGSSLGGQMLCALRQPYFRPAGPRVVFVDNVDPITLTEMVETLEMKRTFFLLISKSGGTPETILQALLARDAISKACGPDVTRHMAAITHGDGFQARMVLDHLGHRRGAQQVGMLAAKYGRGDAFHQVEQAPELRNLA